MAVNPGIMPQMGAPTIVEPKQMPQMIPMVNQTAFTGMENMPKLKGPLQKDTVSFSGETQKPAPVK